MFNFITFEFQVDFCETVLPYLIHDILLSGNNDHSEVLSRQVDNFFSCHCGHTSGRISRCQSTMSASIQLEQGKIYNGITEQTSRPVG